MTETQGESEIVDTTAPIESLLPQLVMNDKSSVCKSSSVNEKGCRSSSGSDGCEIVTVEEKLFHDNGTNLSQNGKDEVPKQELSSSRKEQEDFSVSEKVLQAGISAIKSEPKPKRNTLGKFCSVCSTPTSSRCSRCKKAYYCGTKCQNDDHATHSRACKEGRILDLGDVCGGLAKLFVYLPNIADAFKPLGMLTCEQDGKKQKFFYLSNTPRDYQSIFNLDDPLFENPKEYSFYSDWKVIQEDNNEFLDRNSRDECSGDHIVPRVSLGDPLQNQPTELLEVTKEEDSQRKLCRVPVTYEDFTSMRISHNCMLTSFVAVNVLRKLILNHQIFYHGLRLGDVYSCMSDITADTTPMTIVFASSIPDKLNLSDLEGEIMKPAARTQGHYTTGLRLSGNHCYVLDFSIPQFGIFPNDPKQTLVTGELPYMLYYYDSPQYGLTYGTTKIQSPDEFEEMISDQLGNSDIKGIKEYFQEITQARDVALKWAPNFLSKITGRPYTIYKINK